MELYKKQRGFTLIEMLIAMSIFVVFIGVLMGSYTSIIRAQRDANDYRIMYAESRRVFDGLIQEFREGMVDYSIDEDTSAVFVGAQDQLQLISKDGLTKTLILLADDSVKIAKSEGPAVEVFDGDAVSLNSADVQVKELNMYVYPAVDPYDMKNVSKDAYQFQPKVTIFATFEKEKTTGEPYSVSFQTTVSSRIYNQVVVPK